MSTSQRGSKCNSVKRLEIDTILARLLQIDWLILSTMKTWQCVPTTKQEFTSVLQWLLVAIQLTLLGVDEGGKSYNHR